MQEPFTTELIDGIFLQVPIAVFESQELVVLFAGSLRRYKRAGHIRP